MLFIINKEKIPRLDAKGPLSMNYVNRKTEARRIVTDNHALQRRMDVAKSDYSSTYGGPVGKHM